MFRRANVQQNQVHLQQRVAEDLARPTVLFVCVHNAGRSRMAEAIFDSLAGERYRGISAGTEPAARPHPEVVNAVRANGLAVEERPGRMLTQELTDGAVKVIGMGCAVDEACPALRVPLEDWDLPDPKGRSPEEVEDIYNTIEMKVRNLIAQLDRELGDPPGQL